MHNLNHILSNRNTLYCFLAIVALMPRIIIVLAIGDNPLQLDEVEYDRIAWNLSEGKGFSWFFELPCTFRAPLYPSLLGAIRFYAKKQEHLECSALVIYDDGDP